MQKVGPHDVCYIVNPGSRHTTIRADLTLNGRRRTGEGMQDDEKEQNQSQELFAPVGVNSAWGRSGCLRPENSADRVISIPVAKTHAWAQLTLSLKNFVGVTPLAPYAEWLEPGYWDRGKVFDHSSPEAIAEIYLDVVNAVKPDLAIIDFSIGVEGDGPTVGDENGRTVDVKDRLGSWLLLASPDLVAADATAARVMNHAVDDIKQLKIGYAMGLGEIHEDAIEIVGERLDALRVQWSPAKLRLTLPPKARQGWRPHTVKTEG